MIELDRQGKGAKFKSSISLLYSRIETGSTSAIVYFEWRRSEPGLCSPRQDTTTQFFLSTNHTD
jgi:hypothetical protein